MGNLFRHDKFLHANHTYKFKDYCQECLETVISLSVETDYDSFSDGLGMAQVRMNGFSIMFKCLNGHEWLAQELPNED